MSSYIVSRDYGFAPNPFHGTCTLTCCKPRIRNRSRHNDWVLGIGPKKYNYPLVFFMRVDERLHFNDYWSDPRFLSKRPNLRGSRMYAFGDNIYHQDPQTGIWLQEDSHHSLPDGSPNPKNLKTDTSAPWTLTSRRFTYWGKEGPAIPRDFTGRGAETLLIGIGERTNFSPAFEAEVSGWLTGIGFLGVEGEPRDWKKLHGKPR